MGRTQEVAAQLRGRVLAGEVGPGERLPSTRDLVAEFGIAMATASRVLAALRDEGVAEVVPGVGYRVAARPVPVGAPASGPVEDPALARAVAAAVRTADREGLAAVTIRRAAAEAGIAATTLHRCVVDRAGLVERMCAHVLAAQRWPAAPHGWRARVEQAHQLLWATFRRHPWLVQEVRLTRPRADPSGVEFSERVVTALVDAGLPPAEAFTTHLATFAVLRGVAADLAGDVELQASSGLDTEGWVSAQAPRFRASFLDGAHPAMARVFLEGYDFDLDAIAGTALARVLDGVQHRVAELRAAGLRPRASTPAPARRARRSSS